MELALAQAIEIGASVVVQRHQLTVERDVRELAQGGGDLRKKRREVVALLRKKPHVAALAVRREHAKAVPLDLEDPAGAGERRLAGGGMREVVVGEHGSSAGVVLPDYRLTQEILRAGRKMLTVL